jgi:hypothetical protein
MRPDNPEDMAKDVAFQRLLAQCFGIPVKGESRTQVAHGFAWRGNVYITKVEQVERNGSNPGKS